MDLFSWRVCRRRIAYCCQPFGKTEDYTVRPAFCILYLDNVLLADKYNLRAGMDSTEACGGVSLGCGRRKVLEVSCGAMALTA